jgi:hypothetical protein
LWLDPKDKDYLRYRMVATTGLCPSAEAQRVRICMAMAFDLTIDQPLQCPARLQKKPPPAAQTVVRMFAYGTKHGIGSHKRESAKALNPLPINRKSRSDSSY